jgi:hypothetical protein
VLFGGVFIQPDGTWSYHSDTWLFLVKVQQWQLVLDDLGACMAVLIGQHSLIPLHSICEHIYSIFSALCPISAECTAPSARAGHASAAFEGL